MKPLHQYGTLKDFIEDLEKSPAHHFPFKVMGQKRSPAKKQSAIFQSASMLAEVYRSIPDPDLAVAMPVQPFVPALIDETVPAPDKNGALFMQRVSSLVCMTRDQFILTKIEAALNTHDSVLVIFGGSHWYTQKAALQNSLGSPSFSKPT